MISPCAECGRRCRDDAGAYCDVCGSGPYCYDCLEECCQDLDGGDFFE